MRISTNQFHEKSVTGITSQSSSVLNIQQKLSSGKKISAPSDDPIGSASVQVALQNQSIDAQSLKNINNARNTAEQAESTLGDVGDLLTDARTLVVQGLNGALRTEDRQAIAEELSQRLEQLLSYANTTNGAGGYLFSGFRGATQPFAKSNQTITLQDGSSVTQFAQYFGDDGNQTINITAGRGMEISANGSVVFERVKTGNGTFSTTAQATNTGTGVIDRGININPALYTGNKYQLQFQTPVAPATTSTSFVVVESNPLTNTVISTSAPQNYVDGQSITSIPGISLAITGTPNAGDQFNISPSQNQSMFDTLNRMISALKSPQSNSAGLARLNNIGAETLQNIDNGIQQSLIERTNLGSRLKELDASTNIVETSKLYQDKHLSELQDLDYTSAISDLTKYKVALEAAQRSYTQISELSVFNFMR
jgi:flagellar hook-associated protein 3 FlgL